MLAGNGLDKIDITKNLRNGILEFHLEVYATYEKVGLEAAWAQTVQQSLCQDIHLSRTNHAAFAYGVTALWTNIARGVSDCPTFLRWHDPDQVQRDQSISLYLSLAAPLVDFLVRLYLYYQRSVNPCSKLDFVLEQSCLLGGNVYNDDNRPNKHPDNANQLKTDV